MKKLILILLLICSLGCVETSKPKMVHKSLIQKRVMNIVYGECERYIDISLEDGIIMHIYGLPAGRVGIDVHTPGVDKGQ